MFAFSLFQQNKINTTKADNKRSTSVTFQPVLYYKTVQSFVIAKFFCPFILLYAVVVVVFAIL